MSYQFYVIMQKRKDKQVYCDLHKTTEKIYFTEEDAKKDLELMDDLEPYFHIVPLIAMTETEWEKIVNE